MHWTGWEYVTKACICGDNDALSTSIAYRTTEYLSTAHGITGCPIPESSLFSLLVQSICANITRCIRDKW